MLWRGSPDGRIKISTDWHFLRLSVMGMFRERVIIDHIEIDINDGNTALEIDVSVTKNSTKIFTWAVT